MSLLSRLFLLFVGIPLLELFILVQMGQMVGVLPTIGLVVITGAAGAALARLEGLRTIWNLKAELARGSLPSGALLDGAAILFGGALLLTPGILTDILGFSFLLPPTRKALLKRIRKGLEGRLKSGAIRITHMGAFSEAGAPSWGPPEGWPDSRRRPSGEIVVDGNEIVMEGDETEND
jgi:UPF0716 protein FxsA